MGGMGKLVAKTPEKQSWIMIDDVEMYDECQKHSNEMAIELRQYA